MDFDDWEDIFSGKIPWSLEEFEEIHNWHHELLSTPMDDWDLKERSLLLEDEIIGDTIKVTLNNFMSENQLGIHMLNRFGPEQGRYKIFRFFKIIEFLTKNQSQLHQDGFYKKLYPDFEYDEIKTEVVEALCILPYTEMKISKNEEVYYDYDYNLVVKKAKELMSENDNCK